VQLNAVLPIYATIEIEFEYINLMPPIFSVLEQISNPPDDNLNLLIMKTWAKEGRNLFILWYRYIRIC
jgi:hypothetical protein